MEYLKYRDITFQSFEMLGFKPRPGQIDTVCRIVFSFIDEKMKSTILCAPTGTGKSLIGAATAEALSLVRGLSAEAPKSSIMLCSTNTLAKQYDATFEELAKERKYIMIKGANNYDCSALYQPGQPENAEACAWYQMVTGGSEFEEVVQKHCNKCEYLETKKRKNTVRHLTTNYSYFFVDRMYTGKFEERDLLIWDEAHLINDLFSEHNAIHFSQKRLQAMAKEIAENIRIVDVETAKTLKTITNDCAIPGKINEKNYQQYITALWTKVYKPVKEAAQEQAESSMRSGNKSAYSKYTRFAKKYEGLSCKIDDFFKYGYDHVFEYKEEECAVSVKPIFVSTMMEALQCAEHNLFMSATISEPFMVRTLNLDPAVTKFIKLPPSFPKENKEVVFFDPLSLSYTSLQNPEVVKSLRRNVAKVVKKHIDEGQRGIILAPSFKLQDEIVSEITPLARTGAFKLFEQRKGEKLENTLSAFKDYKGGPAILISPAMFEGIDLPGDLSRFQIMLKAPFPSLGDKRMKWILDRHPDLYNIITIMKMVQGFGRSVRSETDMATSYCLDLNGQRLFAGNHNIWRDEFELRFTKFI